MQAPNVITLQPGQEPDGSPSRQDWSQIAQPDSRYKAEADTPDPKAYHTTPMGTMIPRANPGKFDGTSQGFSTGPGVVNIDPVNWATGEGGIRVDLSQFAHTPHVKSSSELQADARSNWDSFIASHSVEAAAPPPTTERPPNSQSPPLAEGSPVSIPTVAGNPLAPVTAPTLPEAAPAVQTQQAPSTPPTSPVTQPAAPPSPPQPQMPYPPQPPYMYPYPQPAAAVPPELTEAIGAISGTLKSLKEGMDTLRDQFSDTRMVKSATHPSQVHIEPKKAEPQEIDENVERVPVFGDDVGLNFLTNPPSRPQVQVMFDLGKGGKHMKRFHYVSIFGKCLSLILDSRYDGDAFIPPCTSPDDPPVRITFMDSGEVYLALVPEDFNQRIGCLDQLNFVIEEKVESDREYGSGGASIESYR